MKQLTMRYWVLVFCAGTCVPLLVGCSTSRIVKEQFSPRGPYTGVPAKYTGGYIVEYASGAPRLVANYRDGKYHGVLRLYDQKGDIIQERRYRDGMRHGPYFWHVQNMTVQTNYVSGVFRNDKPWDGTFVRAGCEPPSTVVTIRKGVIVAPDWLIKSLGTDQPSDIY